MRRGAKWHSGDANAKNNLYSKTSSLGRIKILVMLRLTMSCNNISHSLTNIGRVIGHAFQMTDHQRQ